MSTKEKKMCVRMCVCMRASAYPRKQYIYIQ